MATRLLAPALLVLLVAPAASDDAETAAQAAEASGHLREAFELYLDAHKALPEPPPEEADLRLRERLYKLASRLDPPPTLSEEAHRFAVRSQVLFSQATSPRELDVAEQEMRKAIRAAPWDASLAFNLALVHEKAEHYGPALANLRLYLATDPVDATQAKTVLYRLELEAERAVERAKQATVREAALPGIVCVFRRGSFPAAKVTIEVDGAKLAQLDNERYFVARLPPGRHTFRMTHAAPIELSIAPRVEHFLKATVARARPPGQLRVVAKDEWQNELQNLRPIDADQIIDTGRVSLSPP